MQYALNYLVQGFCPLKIKITQFPDGFRLNLVNVSLHCPWYFEDVEIHFSINKAPDLYRYNDN